MPNRPKSPEHGVPEQGTGSSVDADLTRAQNAVSELFGNIAAFWGFTRTQGRIYGLLFLSPAPLTANEIRTRLEISTGSTSMTLTSLQGWGVVHRQDRQFVAETDIWKLITGVFRRRERAEVVDAIARMRAGVDALARVPDPSPSIRFARARAESLHDFFKLGRRFLDAFVAQGSGASKVHQLISALAKTSTLFPALSRPSRESRATYRL